MPIFGVSKEKEVWLNSRMSELGIREEDIIEKFVRSSGKGGQHVNKTSTCVYLKHTPTGLEVKCMKDRSQSVNRFLARRELVLKIEQDMGIKTKRDAMALKIKKNKAQRIRRAKAKYGDDEKRIP